MNYDSRMRALAARYAANSNNYDLQLVFYNEMLRLALANLGFTAVPATDLQNVSAQREVNRFLGT